MSRLALDTSDDVEVITDAAGNMGMRNGGMGMGNPRRNGLRSIGSAGRTTPCSGAKIWAKGSRGLACKSENHLRRRSIC